MTHPLTKDEFREGMKHQELRLTVRLGTVIVASAVLFAIIIL